MFLIPNKDKKWSITNNSDVFGTLQRLRNIDFDDEAYIKLAKRARCIYSAVDQSDTSDFQRITAIEYSPTQNKYIIFTGNSGAVYNVNGTSMALTKITAGVDGNVPSMTSTGLNDMVWWQGYIYGTSTISLRRYDSSWSTALTGSGFTGLTAGGYLTVHEQKNYLAIGYLNTVQLLTTAYALSQTLTLPSELAVTSLDYSNGFIIVATRNTKNGKAKVFHWDGNTAVYNNDYTVNTPRVNSVRRYLDSYVIVTGEGELLKFNGSGYSRLAAFPIYFKDQDWDFDGDEILGRIINRGMWVDGELIYINVSTKILIPIGDERNSILENWFENGIYLYDPKVGLHKRYSNSASQRTTETIATASVNTGTNVITVASAPNTGTPVFYFDADSTTISGLENSQKYFVIYVSGTNIKLATTKANAIAGTAITLASTGNNSQSLVYVPNRDFGGSSIGSNSQALDSASAVFGVYNKDLAYRSDVAKLMFGGKMSTSTSSTSNYVLCVGVFYQENRGYIITPKLFSSSLTEVFQNVSIKFKGITTELDKIIVKYRTIDRTDTLTGIKLNGSTYKPLATWVNSTSFTTTDNISSAKKGDEVSFHNGVGSGYIAHISTISENAGTYTVNLDETIENNVGGNECAFVIENWNKIGTITTADVDYFTNDNGDRYISASGLKTFFIEKQAKWIEIKAELRGEDVIIEEILVNGKPYKTFIK